MHNKRIYSYCSHGYLSALLLLLAAPLYAEPWIVGNAVSPSDGELLYKELHYQSANATMLSERVEYVSPSGELLVEKTLDSSGSPIVPAVAQNDLRTGTRFSISDTGDSFDTRYQRGGEALQRKRLDKKPRLVIDAGFDAYVRANWDALQSGNAIRADFFVPARLDTVGISIRRTDTEQCASITSPALCLVVRPAGLLRLVGWFVDPLYVAYAQDSQRLLLYRGISNLLDANGESQDVLIRYQYTEADGETS